MTLMEYEAKLCSIQTSAASFEVKSEAIRKLDREYYGVPCDSVVEHNSEEDLNDVIFGENNPD